MRIANPLFDHAFKYLMSNDKLAKKVLSTILDKEVLELELSQQEIVVADDVRHFTLYRLDFKALIRDENGKEEQVLIEIQKSKLPNNILRFRTYLGFAYTQKNPKSTLEEEEAFPIISIYILGYKIQDIPVLACKVDRKIIDTSTKQEINIQSDFIDLLTHTCYILQAGRLPEKRQSKIEQFMTLFNQAWVEEQRYILDLEEVPEDFKDVAEYLQRPLLDSDTIRKLVAEQEIEELFAEHESNIAAMQQEVEKAKASALEAHLIAEEAKAKVEEANAKAEEAKAKAEEANALAKTKELEANAKIAESLLREEEAKQKSLEESRKSEFILNQTIKALSQAAFDSEKIAEMLGIDKETVEKHLLNML